MKQTQINSGHICMTIIVEQNRIPDSFLVNGLCEKDWFQIFLGNRRRRIQAERLFAKNFILDVWQGGSESGSEHISAICNNQKFIGHVLIFRDVNRHLISSQKLPHYIWNGFLNLYVPVATDGIYEI